MGGNAFAHLDPPIYPVRLPTTLYNKLRDHNISLLSKLFSNVGSPLPAPEKSSHGDIDILVSHPKRSFLDSFASSSPLATTRSSPGSSNSDPDVLSKADIGPYLPAIKTLIKPTAHIHLRNAPSISLAMYLRAPSKPPTSGPQENVLSKGATAKGASTSADPTEYFQLDITLLPTSPPNLFTWNLLLNSYGGLFSILAIPLRQVGIVANPSGLSLISETLEKQGKKRGRLLLSSDADAILGFLGLPPLEILQPGATFQEHKRQRGVERGAKRLRLQTVKELFEVISESRFFDPGTYWRFHEGRVSSQQSDQRSKGLRSGDRARMERPMFKRFVQEHLVQFEVERAKEREKERENWRKRKREWTSVKDLVHGEEPGVDGTLEEVQLPVRSPGELEEGSPLLASLDHWKEEDVRITEVESTVELVKRALVEEEVAEEIVPEPRDSGLSSSPSSSLPSSSPPSSETFIDPFAPPSREAVRDDALWTFKSGREWQLMHEVAAMGDKLQALKKTVLQNEWDKGVRREEAEMWMGYSRSWLNYMGIIEHKRRENGEVVSMYEYPIYF